MRRFFSIIGFTCLFSLALQANPTFTENKGQILDFNGKKQAEIAFTVHDGAAQVFISNHALHYQFLKSYGEGEQANTQFSRIEVSLQGANPQARAIGEVKSENRPESWFTPGQTKAIQPDEYERVVVREVYPKIDWVLYFAGGKLKYDFIVHPGGQIDQIRFKYRGANSVKTEKDGSLLVMCDLGEIRELPVVCMQSNNTIEGKFVQTEIDEVGFSVADYDRSSDLVIDPGVLWATYFGGQLEEKGFGLITAGDYYYICGGSLSTNLVASPGVYQGTLSGTLQDGLIAKFHKSGNRIWSTYFGGTATEQLQGISLNSNGQLLVCGLSQSTGLATAGAHQVTKGSGQDGILASFDTSGTILNWATYYGGNQNDWAYDVKSDASGDIYLTLEARSTNGTTIATAGSHQSTPGGLIDAALVKFNAAGQRQWGTYFGGSDNDHGYKLGIFNDGRVALTGKSASTNLMIMNGFQTANLGGFDSYLAVFNGSGTLEYSSYYGGSGEDIGRALSITPSGSVVICGQTASTDLSTNGHQTTYGGGIYDAFILKLNPSFAPEWSTYYGGGVTDYGYAITSDSAKIYCAGSSASPDQISFNGFLNARVTNSLGQSNTDAFIAVFDHSGNRKWASFQGSFNSADQFSADRADGVVVDQEGKIVLLGQAEGNEGLAVNGWQANNSGGKDIFLSRIDPTEIFVDSLNTQQFCRGDSVFLHYQSLAQFGAGNQFNIEMMKDSSGLYSSPVLIGTVSGSASSGTLAAVIPSNLDNNSTYHFRINSTDPPLTGAVFQPLSSVVTCIETGNIDLSGMPFCGGSDISIPVVVNGPALVPGNIFIAQLSNPNGSFNLPIPLGGVLADSNSTIQGQFPIGLPAGNQYRIRIRSTNPVFFSDPYPTPIEIHHPNLGLDFTIGQNVLSPPYNALFTNTSSDPTLNYFWFFGDGNFENNNATTVAHQYGFSGNYHVALFAIDSVTGCRDTLFNPLDSGRTVYCTSGSVNCQLNPVISPSGTGGVISACAGGNVTLTCNAVNGADYQWNLNGVPLGGETQPSLTTGVPGFYSVTISDSLCFEVSNTVQITFNQAAVPVPTITQTNNLLPCNGGSATLTASAGYSSYLWSTGETTPGITVSSSGAYTVTGFTGALGCFAVSDTVFLNGSAVSAPPICVVTVDTSGVHNVVVWEKPVTTAIDSFIVYREDGQQGIYNRIGAVHYDSLSEYLDITSNSQVRAYRYKIAAKDTCGGVSLPSAFHKTMHLQVSPGQGIARNLSWTHYEGLTFPTYEISRSAFQSPFTLLQSLPSTNNTFTDLVPPNGPSAWYYVEIVLPQTCNSTRAARNKSASNATGNLTVFVPDTANPLKTEEIRLKDFEITPNPSAGRFQLRIPGLSGPESAFYQIEDISGRLVKAETEIKGSDTEVILNEAAGVYLLKLRIGNHSESRKLVLTGR